MYADWLSDGSLGASRRYRPDADVMNISVLVSIGTGVHVDPAEVDETS
ncbi:MAG: hypothetical protein ACRD0Z_03225 [Acidimicrobiales bacterium]